MWGCCEKVDLLGVMPALKRHGGPGAPPSHGAWCVDTGGRGVHHSVCICTNGIHLVVAFTYP